MHRLWQGLCCEAAGLACRHARVFTAPIGGPFHRYTCSKSFVISSRPYKQIGSYVEAYGPNGTEIPAWLLR